MTRPFFHKLLLNLSSKDELDVTLNDDGGSTSRYRGNHKLRKYIRREHIQGHERLFRDYFAEEPVYLSNLFQRRFCMSRLLFRRIQHEVETYEPYFIQRRDNAERLGLSFMQKITASLRIVAYGATGDFMDEYIRIGESTAIESLKTFVKTIVNTFSNKYLWSLNANDIARLFAVGKQHGFLRMLGSIDCMHWKWTNSPAAWKCMYFSHSRELIIILEVVVSYDLWIWYAFFGMPDLHNDINVLERYFIFTKLAQGRAPPVNYSINGNDYTMGYYFANGIYLKWTTFVKTISSPQRNKKKNFAAAQESARNDVKHAFGILQQRFAIIRGPSRMFKMKELTNIIQACVILHNMIIED